MALAAPYDFVVLKDRAIVYNLDTGDEVVRLNPSERSAQLIEKVCAVLNEDPENDQCTWSR